MKKVYTALWALLAGALIVALTIALSPKKEEPCPYCRKR